MKTTTGLIGLVCFSYLAVMAGCNVPPFIAHIALLSQSPSRSDIPALTVKSKPAVTLVTTKGAVTWYGTKYEGKTMNGGGTYRDRGPIIIASPVKRDRHGRAIRPGGRYQPIFPYGTKVRITLPNGRSIVAPIGDTCPADTWDTNRTGMSGLGFADPMQKIKGARVEVLL